MNASLPGRQTFSSSRSYSYSYIHCEGRDGRPTLLLLHGWPSHADDWIYQINTFRPKGYGLLVPDLLGYGGSSRPSDVKSYLLRLVSQDLAELLDHVGLQKVVGVGHDWGATLLSRFAIYHHERLSALALLGIGASAPGAAFELDAINEMTRKATGTEMLGYVTYIARDPSSQRMMEENAESVMDVMFAADPTSWPQHLHAANGLKGFVEGGRRQKVGDWFPPELQARHLEVFGRKDGHLGSTRYYMMLDQNLSVPDETDYVSFKIPQPVLLVVPREPEGLAQAQAGMTSAWAPRLTVKTVDSGHWVHMERSRETNEAIEEFLRDL